MIRQLIFLLIWCACGFAPVLLLVLKEKEIKLGQLLSYLVTIGFGPISLAIGVFVWVERRSDTILWKSKPPEIALAVPLNQTTHYELGQWK